MHVDCTSPLVATSYGGCHFEGVLFWLHIYYIGFQQGQQSVCQGYVFSSSA